MITPSQNLLLAGIAEEFAVVCETTNLQPTELEAKGEFLKELLAVLGPVFLEFLLNYFNKQLSSSSSS